MSRFLWRVALALLLTTSAPAAAVEALLADDGGTLSLILADAEGRPLADTALAEDIGSIDAALHWNGSGSIRVTLRLLAQSVPGLPDGMELWRDRFLFIAGERWRPSIARRGAGFEIGRYLLEAETENGAVLHLPLEIVPGHHVTRLIESLPEGVDLALAALGASVTSPQPAESSRWVPENLIDGFVRIRDDRGGLVSAGWRAASAAPAEVVLSLAGAQAPMIDRLVFETLAEDGYVPLRSGFLTSSIVPHHVEIAVSSAEGPENFEVIATVRLWNRAAKQLVDVAPVVARHVRLRLLGAYGGGPGAALGEVRIYAADPGAALAGTPRNIALPALGGHIAAVSSESPDNRAIELIDGAVGPERGWSSAAGTDGAPLPQDVVLAFRGGEAAAIDRVEIHPESSPRYAVGTFDRNWPSAVTIAVAMDSPLGPFEDIARIDMAQEPTTAVVPVGRTARFLRLRVHENHGGDRVTIGEVAVYETAEDGDSILARQLDHAWGQSEAASRRADLPDGPVETEPNDMSARDSLPLDGSPVRGALEPSDDVDRWRLEIAGTQDRTVTLVLQTSGILRTGLRLLDTDDQPVKTFQPVNLGQTEARVTWRLRPGLYELEVYEPQRTTALVWDTSGSMVGRSEALEQAVRGYIEAMGSHEAILPVRFASTVDALLEEPSADRATLLEAIGGGFEPDGGTMLFDGVELARAALDESRGARSIIVLTDGQDTGSRIMLGDLRRNLASSNIHLLAIGLGDSLDELGLAGGGTGHDVLRGMAQSAGGRYIVQPDADDLPALYAALAAELGGVQHYALSAEAAREAGLLEVARIGGPIAGLVAMPSIVLVLDASGSMKRTIGGRAMMEIARAVLTDVVRDLPGGVEAALWTFGHRVREGQTGDCEDIEMMVPMGPLAREDMIGRIEGVRALGTTPIAGTLERVAASLRDRSGQQIVVLVTDGEEECRDDLEAVAHGLRADGLDLDLHIVGFGMEDEAVRAGLARAAEAAGGGFLHAGEADSLARAVNDALAAGYTVLDGAGETVAHGRIGAAPLALPVGHYDLRIETTGAPLVIGGIAIEAGATTRVTLEMQGHDIGVATATLQP